VEPSLEIDDNARWTAHSTTIMGLNVRKLSTRSNHYTWREATFDMELIWTIKHSPAESRVVITLPTRVFICDGCRIPNTVHSRNTTGGELRV
jgi:hypothetical protein